jgi:hypothetical protein
MPNFPGGQLHINTWLTQVSLWARNDDANFVAEFLYPQFPSDKDSDFILQYGTNSFDHLPTLRAPGGEAKWSNFRLLPPTDKFLCQGHALKAAVPREFQRRADAPIKPREDTAKMILDQLRLDQEIATAQKAAAALTTNLHTLSTPSGIYGPWNNDAYNPIVQVKTDKNLIRLATGRKPNKMLFNEYAWLSFTENANVRARITGAPNIEASLITETMVAGILGLKEVRVAPTVYNTAEPGQTMAGGDVWQDASGKPVAYLFFSEPPGLYTVNPGHTYTWMKALQEMDEMKEAEGVGASSVFTEMYYSRKRKADIVEVHSYYDVHTSFPGAAIQYAAVNG